MSDPVETVATRVRKKPAVLTFREEDHTYALDGKPLLSVTTILRLAGLISFDGVNPEVLQNAMARGSRVHRATELDDLGQLDIASVLEDDIGYLMAWQRFRRETGFRPEHVERRVFSHRYGYAGTLDRIGFLKRQRWLLDVKTGIRHPAVGPQTAAYRECLRHKHLPRGAVYLKADGHYDFRLLNEKDDLATFLAALRVVRWKEKHA